MRHRWAFDGIEEREPGIELNGWRCSSCGMTVYTMGSWPPSDAQLEVALAAATCDEFRVEEVMGS